MDQKADPAASHAVFGRTSPLKVLLIATRDPRGKMSGRKMVLRTIVDSVTQLGCDLTVAHFGAPEGPEIDGAVHYLQMPKVGTLSRLSGAGLAFALGRRSINEALYTSAENHRQIAALIKEERIALVITDMIRTAAYGARSGLPWIADLDDLLSERYTRMASDTKSASNLMGYDDGAALRLVARLFSRLQPVVLRREATVLRRREAEIAKRADVATLVSGLEAKQLSQLTGENIRATPMAVEEPRSTCAPETRRKELVFLGGLDYGPNLKSLIQFDREVAPALAQMGLGAIRLDVIGTAPARDRGRLSGNIHCLNYVDDLDQALQGYRAMLVPEVQPGGVKTKIVVSAMNRTLVLAHETALGGMGLTPELNVLAWRTPDDLARQIARLRAGEVDLSLMTDAALRWARENFGKDHLRDLWQAHLEDALRAPR